MGKFQINEVETFSCILCSLKQNLYSDQIKPFSIKQKLSSPTGMLVFLSPKQGKRVILVGFLMAKHLLWFTKNSLLDISPPKQNSYDEAHTGSWQRCLEGSIRLMEQAREILTNLSDPKLKSQVLATSQMQDYLASKFFLLFLVGVYCIIFF